METEKGICKRTNLRETLQISLLYRKKENIQSNAMAGGPGSDLP